MNIYVGNLLPNVSEKDLRKAFEEFGLVRNVHLIADRNSNQSNGYGFVEMSSEDEAEKAIDNMNGKEFMEKSLVVNEARPQRTGERGSSGGGGRGGFNRDRGGFGKGRGTGNRKGRR